MTVSKQDDGKYLADVRPQGRTGKRYRRLFKTRGEALEFERWVMSSQNNKEWIKKPADKRPLLDLIELWWKLHGSTLRSGKSMYNKLININSDLNNPRACDINMKLFSQYQALRIEKGRKPETINKARWLLSGVFTSLIKTGNFLSDNPMKGIKNLKVNQREMGYLNKEQVRDLLDDLSGDNLKMVKLSLATGGRWGEIKNLTRSSVIKYKVTFTKTKNGKSRTVPISPALWEEITEGKSHILFPNADYYQVRDALIMQFPELPEGQAFHVLRHTFASHFMMGGGNILALQKILGHSTINQTMVYAHFAPDYLQDAVRLNVLESIGE
ncbi:tyrosine-type recombinase/integrase [Salmonella enterica]|nr:tyrosine-type recombinase/integrase [Salmonella enterica]EIC4368333.1 tyrosine-type recombinase/integrase [Salmonella enterica]EKC5811942.1 tyrosine-type recombinase/integrase [Salmonella enterica]ELM3104104.1 tyrosine-type recombinase/integrase [Salmonella enterica]